MPQLPQVFRDIAAIHPGVPADATSRVNPAPSKCALDILPRSVRFTHPHGRVVSRLPGRLSIPFVGKIPDCAVNRQQGKSHMNTHRLIRILLILALVAGVTLAVLYRDRFDAAALQSWVQEAGIAAPLLFMLIYALATVLFLPGSVLTLAGGALFGPVLGTFYNLTGATAGAALAFLIARYLASDWVARKAGGRVKQLIDGVENEGWRFVAFVRLVPLFPFNLLNYALGLTRLKLGHYLIASYVFMLPGAIAYTYLGYAGREAVAGGEGLIHKGLLALALLAVVTFLPRLIKNMKKTG
jgi:uncharacterized membrane protein YdjX (TVP38/TMEM64 family)